MNDERGAEAPEEIPGANDPALKRVVEREIKEIKNFLKDLKLDDIKDGSWFARLVGFALASYADKVDAAYFRTKYPHLPPDAIAQERISLAAKFAALEGGLSSFAYTSAIAATLGTGGGASPLTLPAGGLSFCVDLTYTTRLQLRLAYDLSVLYGVPLDLDDPQDLWKFLRIAMGVKAGEVGGEAALKGVPVAIRPIVKKIFSGSTLATAKSLPVVGKYLLQRNIIKFSMPMVGVPVTVAVNYWMTRAVGRQARELLRREAKAIEAAERLVDSGDALEAMVLAMLLVMQADGKFDSDENGLLNHVTKLMGERGDHSGFLHAVRNTVQLDRSNALAVIQEASDGEAGRQIYDGALLAAAVNGEIARVELAALRELAAVCGVPFDPQHARALAREW